MNKYRALFIIFFVLIVFGVLGTKLFSIQIFKHEYYVALARNQQNSIEDVKAVRGNIEDRKGDILAYTNDRVAYFADCRMLDSKEIQEVAETFSKIFNKSVNHYKRLMINSSKNVCLEPSVTHEKAELIKRLSIDGLFTEEKHERVYPYKNLAAHVLGYVNSNYKGQSGIEKIYNDFLKGKDGKLLLERDVRGRTVSIDNGSINSVIDGSTVRLTINSNYQKILETALANGINKFGGKSAVGIIMEPNTGEILALANLPVFNPSEYNKYQDNNRRNRSITDTYEPGSTFKSIVMAALLNEGLVQEDQIVNTENGAYRFKSVIIRDTHEFDFLSVKGVLEHSSNIGMAKLASKLDDEIFYKYLRDFGFGNLTSIDLPGEIKGKLRKPFDFSKITKQYMSFGYGIAVTPLQMITSYSSLLNGGKLMRPYIMKEIRNKNGEVIKENESEFIREVIDEATSRKIREFMKGVVDSGTAETAKIEGVEIGGKTGTTQLLLNNGYSNRKYNSSFIGFFPIDNPQIVCFILVTSPEKGRYGGKVAAPIFKEAIKNILNIDPELAKYKKHESYDEQKDLFITASSNENFQQYSNIEEKEVEKPENFNFETTNKMPNLKNLSKREAISKLSALGIKYKVSGAGKVVSQSIRPGRKIRKGYICYLKCSLGKNIKAVKLN